MINMVLEKVILHLMLQLNLQMKYIIYYNKTLTIAIFVDLAKPFDTFDHKKLISKLESIGIIDVALSLMKRHLKNRKQRIRGVSVLNKANELSYGVPQETILGLLLFLLYANDLCNIKINCKIISFSDETTMIFDGSSWDKLLLKLRQELV